MNKAHWRTCNSWSLDPDVGKALVSKISVQEARETGRLGDRIHLNHLLNGCTPVAFTTNGSDFVVCLDIRY